MAEFNHQYVRIDTERNMYGSFPNTDIDFKISRLNKHVGLKKSFASIRLNIIQTDNAGNKKTLSPLEIVAPAGGAPGIVGFPYLSNNPFMCLFDKTYCEIGNLKQQIYNSQNISLDTTLFRTITESQEEQKIYSTNSIEPLSIEDTYTALTVRTYIASMFPNYDFANLATNFGDVFTSKHGKYALKRLMGFNQYSMGQLNAQIPIPLFMTCDGELPPNIPELKIVFTPNSSYYNDLIKFSGGTKNLSVRPMLTAGDAPLANSIYVGVDDFCLYLYTYDKVTIPKSLSLNWIGFESNKFSITPNATNFKQSFSFSSNKLITKLAVCFAQPHSTAGVTNYGTSQTQLDAGFAYNVNGNSMSYVTTNNAAGGTTSTNLNNPAWYLNDIFITFNNIMFPKNRYNLDFNYNKVVTGTAANAYIMSSANDNWRAYQDYLLNCPVSMTDRSSNLLSYDKWIVSPIFVMNCLSNEQASNSGSIELKFNQGVQNSVLFVLGLTTEQMNIQYDDKGEVAIEY